MRSTRWPCSIRSGGGAAAARQGTLSRYRSTMSFGSKKDESPLPKSWWSAPPIRRQAAGFA